MEKVVVVLALLLPAAYLGWYLRRSFKGKGGGCSGCSRCPRGRHKT